MENTYYGDVDSDGNSEDDDSVGWSSDDNTSTYNDAPIDSSRNLFVWNWLWTYDFAISNNGADSVISVGVKLVCKKYNFFALPNNIKSLDFCVGNSFFHVR